MSTFKKYVTIILIICQLRTGASQRNKVNFMINIAVNNDDAIYPTPPLGQDMTQGQFLSGV